MNPKQLEEAKQLAKEGNSLSKRSLTRWTPDWDTAATKFERAATIYKNLKLNDDSVQYYCKAGDAFYKSNSAYLSGKNYEAAGNVRRDEKRFTDATKFYEQAAQFYLEDGKPERASEVLLKAARSLEQNIKTQSMFAEDPASQQIIQIYRKVVDIFYNEKKFHMMPDPLRSYHSFLLKQNLLKEAIESFTLAIEVFEGLKQQHNIFKTYLSIVILHLANDDFASADDAHASFCTNNPAYDRSEEGDIATQFLSAFEHFAAEDLEHIKKDSKLKFLEPQVYNLVKNMKLSGGGKDRVQRARREDSELSSKKKALLGDDLGELDVDEDGCDENGVPIRREVDLTGADEEEEDLTGAPVSKRSSTRRQEPEEEEGDIFDEEDLT